MVILSDSGSIEINKGNGWIYLGDTVGDWVIEQYSSKLYMKLDVIIKEFNLFFDLLGYELKYSKEIKKETSTILKKLNIPVPIRRFNGELAKQEKYSSETFEIQNYNVCHNAFSNIKSLKMSNGRLQFEKDLEESFITDLLLMIIKNETINLNFVFDKSDTVLEMEMKDESRTNK